MNKKTERKNKTNQIVSWPSNDTYFTIDSLIETNKDMLTSSGSDITLRVRLAKAITEEKMVASIGTKNCGKGRPKLAFAMTPVIKSALDKAKSDGIMLYDETQLVTIMEIKPKANDNPTPPVVNIPNTTAVTV